MTAPASDVQRIRLAQETRKRFVADASQAMDGLVAAVQERLSAPKQESVPAPELKARREFRELYQSQRADWLQATRKAWQAALESPPVALRKVEPGGLELVATDVVENQILASRLAMAVQDKAGAELSDLLLRIRFLEGAPDPHARDILQPELLLQLMVEQWLGAGLPREAWPLVQDVVQTCLIESLPPAYARGNAFLIQQGVLATIELRDQFKRASGQEPRPAKSVAASPTDRTTAVQAARADGVDGHRPSISPPVARGTGRALGVLQNLRRLLTGVSADADSDGEADFAATAFQGPSPALAAALARAVPRSEADQATVVEDGSPAGVQRAASALRERSVALKHEAQTSGEKATIEIVALMFQSILQEDRIPPRIRVWFARLQMPVLRVALAEPDFFGTLNHPARLLIDRMGSCVMGFDASGIQGSELETEIKRVVQVIEQYPETGRRVYQTVYQEFQVFLAKFLTGKALTQNLVSVAQQVEQKETLTIQYTIEMRNMLKDLPVRDEIREFLFKVWAEVLAVAAVRYGPQDAQTLALKKSAIDLVWATGAKPQRADRTRVIQEWPLLVQRLRAGMTLLGLAAERQDAQVKMVSATLTDAFLSKDQAIAGEQIQALAQRLERLEDFVSDDDMAPLSLDNESIEMILGLDASMIDVVADGGTQPDSAMLAWARELQSGAWFTLDHNGRLAQVQFVWRSEGKHLNLFAASDGHCYLLQTGRLAAYLQAGLLTPQEEEALTVRATRDALVKLEANPERLLS